MKISFIGFVKKPFEFYDIDDFLLIESMKKIRKDEKIICDWKTIKKDFTTDSAFDLETTKKIPYDLKKSDLLVFLEIPHHASEYGDQKKVNKLLKKMKKYLKIPTLNDIDSFFEYPDKSYILKFQDLPFPKTRKINTKNLEEILSEFDKEIILKPLDGGGGFGLYKTENNIDTVKKIISNSKAQYLIQEYLPEIKEGERSLFYIDKKLRYAIRKLPKPSEFRSNEIYCQSIERYEPTNKEIEISEKAIKTLNSKALIERVDIAAERIIEITTESPGLYINYAKVEEDIGRWFYEAIETTLKTR